MPTAFAHDLAADLYEPLPEGLFDYKMDWDPTLVLFLCLGIFYYRGLKAFRGELPIQKWQIFCFYLGILVNVVALSPPVDPLSDRLFFMHMIQHMLIVSVGSPLMLFGAPWFIISRGLSPGFRRRIYFPFIRNRLIRNLHKILAIPLVSLAIFEGNYWFWHVPRYYNWALLNDIVHLLEHACMAFTSFYLWRNIIDPWPLRSQLHMGFRLLFLAAIMALNTVLGAALTYATEVWYAYEGIPMPKWWSYRWGHLDDQRLGGLIMWVPGGFITFLSMTICFFVWVHREQRKDARRQQQKTFSDEAHAGKGSLVPVTDG